MTRVTYPVCLGIDPGLECTGWAVLNERRQCIAYGGIKSDPRKPDRERIVEIESQLSELIRSQGPDVELAYSAVETYGYQGKHSESGNAFRLPRLVGSLETLCRCEGIAVTGFTRGQGLQAIGCATNAKEADAKRAIGILVKRYGGLLPSNEHSRAAYAQAWRAQIVRRR